MEFLHLATGKSVISSLIRTIMSRQGLRQAEMAEILGVSIDRVKSLTSGRVGKLTPEEAKALVQKLHVRGDYLATGAEPVFQTPQEMDFENRLGLLKEASSKAQMLELPERYQAFVRDILFGVALDKPEMLIATIEGLLAERSREPPPEPTPPSRPVKRSPKKT